MLRLLNFLLIIAICQSQRQTSKELDCSDLKGVNVIGKLALKYSKIVLRDEDFPVNFIISTDKNKNFVRVNEGDWSWLKDSWDIFQKTYIIVHGFKSGGEKPWVKEMTQKLIEKKKGNVLIVDWTKGSNVLNYVDAAKNTQIVSRKTGRFLDQLMRQIDREYDLPTNTLWNHIHFIGHSLGAQISAQVAYILKPKSNVWKLERITGLDPAKPCFHKNLTDTLKLDKSDADLVDVIHTQVGLGGDMDGLGLKNPIGHIDFYVNSGVVQPKCLGSIFRLNLETMICSHKLATKYFVQSLDIPQNSTCSFRGYPWDGTFMHAQDVLTEKLKGSVCYDCPEMGIYADQSKQNGTYLVITGEDEPFCQLDKDKQVNNLVKVFWKFKGTTPIFNF